MTTPSLHAQVCDAAAAMAPHAGCFHMAYLTQGSWQLQAPAAPVQLADAGGSQQADGRHNDGAPQERGMAGMDVDAQSFSPEQENSDRGNGASAAHQPCVAPEAADKAGAIAKPAPHAPGQQQRQQVEGSKVTEKITFLYKVRGGAAGASFGLNVAMMAGLPSTVVSRAATVARTLERASPQSGERLDHRADSAEAASSSGAVGDNVLTQEGLDEFRRVFGGGTAPGGTTELRAEN